ncbi:hypothetical protein MC885_015191 [Smutsia gigantea]|nr:hypothetical protein MC885_015191 [Smutsia gigantea]
MPSSSSARPPTRFICFVPKSRKTRRGGCRRVGLRGEGYRRTKRWEWKFQKIKRNLPC